MHSDKKREKRGKQGGGSLACVVLMTMKIEFTWELSMDGWMERSGAEQHLNQGRDGSVGCVCVCG